MHKRRLGIISTAALFVSMFLFSGVYAHEWILKPQFWHQYTSGLELPFSIVSSHVFMKSEELENPQNVGASFEGGQIPLTANAVFKSYDGKITLTKPGAAIIRAHRKGEVWSMTTQGMKKGDRKTLQGVIESRKYEKFCKTLLPVDGNSTGYDRQVGDKLEIVPLDNPLKARVGQELRFKILYSGRPVSTEVTASYDGFSDTPNTYAYFTEPYGEGEAKVRISAPGLWMVRVQHAVAEKGENFEKHIMRAVLVFPVKGE
jgi:uncharacterized GH25 family protein